MSDLRVEYAALEAAQTDLARIEREFAHAEATRDRNESIWGPEVDGAMEDFINNWDRHRGDLLESVRAVGDMCAAACDTFRGVESALNDALTGGQAGAPTAGPAGGPASRPTTGQLP